MKTYGDFMEKNVGENSASQNCHELVLLWIATSLVKAKQGQARQFESPRSKIRLQNVKQVFRKRKRRSKWKKGKHRSATSLWNGGQTAYQNGATRQRNWAFFLRHTDRQRSKTYTFHLPLLRHCYLCVTYIGNSP